MSEHRSTHELIARAESRGCLAGFIMGAAVSNAIWAIVRLVMSR